MIDVHHHFLPPQYVARIGPAAVGLPSPVGTVPAWSIAQALETMDAHGIGTAVTSISAPGLQLDDERSTASLARSCNEFAADMMRSHPSRFGMFAAIPLPYLAASLVEVEYAFETLATSGVSLMTNYAGRYLGHPDFVPLFEALDGRGAVVFVHPTSCSAPLCDPDVVPSTIEFPFDTTRTIVSLIANRRHLQFPSLRFIFCHAGGATSVPADRIASQLGRTPAIISRGDLDVIGALRGLYYDTAGYFSSSQLDALLRIAPIEHVLFGSDYPFVASVEAAVAALTCLPNDRRIMIATSNARSLFPQFVDQTDRKLSALRPDATASARAYSK
jgi:predicted TIM-barrel fold metal-dependent hydrolase